jgi:hypothetical protein
MKLSPRSEGERKLVFRSKEKRKFDFSSVFVGEGRLEERFWVGTNRRRKKILGE